MIKILNITFLFTVLFVANSFAQRNFTMYSSQTAIQTTSLNPAFRPNAKFYIVTPINLNNVGFSNSGFALKKLLTRRSDDSLVIDPSKLLSNLKSTNVQFLELNYDVLGFGFRLGKNYLTFNSVIKANQNFVYTKDLFDFIINGNGGSFLGQRAAIGDLSINLNAYAEYSVGFNRIFFDKLTLGAKAKLLSGIANVNTKEMNLGLYTDPNDFDLTVDGKFSIQQSGLNFISNDSTSTNENEEIEYKRAYDFKNRGIAFDFGASYMLNDKISFNASVLDLGFINWKANAKEYYSNQLSYTFEGVDLSNVFSDSLSEDFGSELIDSLSNMFNQNERTVNYTTKLYSKFFLGGQYKLNKNISFGATYYGELLPNKLRSALILSSKFDLGKMITLTLNHSSYANAITNIGVGAIFRFGDVQLFAMTDNIYNLIDPTYGRNFHGSVGFNIMIGENKDSEKAKKKIEKAEDKNQEKVRNSENEIQKETEKAEKK